MKETKAIITKGGRLTYDSGKARKAINPWDSEDTPEAWTPFTDQNKKAIRLVPSIYNAWQARCKAMADLPFTIYKGETEIDNSDDWTNQVGFLANPRMFFWMCEAALVGYGSAYWSKNKNDYKVTKQLQYFVPSTITPEITPQKGLVGFKRANGNVSIPLKVEDLLYIWLPDPAVEVGAPTAWPLESALACAGAVERINAFVADFMARGMVKATMLTVDSPTQPTAAEKENIETFWNKFMRGVQTRFRVFSNKIIPTIVGEGLEAFKGIEITTELFQQINTAMGTRHLLEDENYATADVRQREFYVNTIMPDARLIADALNTQVLNEYGYTLRFEPERLEAFKVDEAERATALGTLAGAISNNSPEAVTLAMSILGYVLDNDQQKMLDELMAQKQQDREQAKQAFEQKQQDGQANSQDEAPNDAPMREDMAKFLRKALKKPGKDVEFESENIPAERMTYLHARLPDCKCAEEVRALFATDETPAPVFTDPLLVLANTLRDAVKVLSETTSDPQPAA